MLLWLSNLDTPMGGGDASAAVEDENITDDFASSTTLIDLVGYRVHSGPDAPNNLGPSAPADTSDNPAEDASNLLVGKKNGRYWSSLLDNTSNLSLHYYLDQGRLDAKRVTFPFIYVATNIGITPVADTDPDDDYSLPSGDPYNFCGIQVHVYGTGDSETHDLDDQDSAHMVIGHRGSSRAATIEGKQTANGVSAVTDEGANLLGTGVTHCDMRFRGLWSTTNSRWWVEASYRDANSSDAWTLWGDGDGREGREGPGELDSGGGPGYTEQADFSSGEAYIGLITYASGTDGVPFNGTCEDINLKRGALLTNRSIANFGGMR